MFGDSITGARYTEIVFGLVALAGTGLVAWLLGGPWAASISALTLSVSPGFLVYSRAVEGEIPMMALVTLSLALALMYGRSGRVTWAMLAGGALSAAILTKLFAAEAIVLVVWAMACPGGITRRWVRGTAVLTSVVFVLITSNFALVAPGPQWAQVVSLHNRAAAIHLANVTSPFVLYKQFLLLDSGLAILAFAGILTLGITRRWREFGLLFLWFPGTSAMLLLFRPLFPHHLAILLASMAVSAGVGLSSLCYPVRWRLGVRTVVAASACLLYGLALPRLVHADRHALVSVPSSVASSVASYIRSHTRVQDLIAVDDLRLAEYAHRLVVPPLCDPSNVRLRAGYLTKRDLITATRTYKPRIVVSSSLIYSQVPGYIRWLKTSYISHQIASGVTAYLRR
ncbi:MAG: hypothetical protein NVSMB52_07360 [Chloroflexota bacterium]